MPEQELNKPLLYFVLAPIAVYVGFMLGSWQTLDPCEALDRQMVDYLNKDHKNPDDRLGILGRAAVTEWRMKRYDNPLECIVGLYDWY